MLYKERGLQRAERKQSENKDMISQLLIAIWEFKEVVIFHCKGHQKLKDTVILGIQTRPPN